MFCMTIFIFFVNVVGKKELVLDSTETVRNIAKLRNNFEFWNLMFESNILEKQAI